MTNNQEKKSALRRILPRIVKAVIKGALLITILYVLPIRIFSLLASSLPQGAPDIISRYEQFAVVFATFFVFFVVASELTSGTIFQHGFNVGRALVFMVLVVYALEGEVGMDYQNLHVVADLTVFLVMLLTINLVGLAKSMLQAVDFLSEKTESQLPSPRLV